MAAHGNNATPPAPAIAPGSEEINPAEVARELAKRWPALENDSSGLHSSNGACDGGGLGRGGLDHRVARLVPGFDAPFFQAGLAGYSDAAMRIVARRLGAPYCVTEALLDRMLLGGGHGFDKADLEMLTDALPCGREDTPLSGQIIGSDPDEMAAGALKMLEQGKRPDKAYREIAYGPGRQPHYVDTRWKVEGEQAATSTGATGEQLDGACEDDCTPEALLALANEQPPETYDPRSVFAHTHRPSSPARAASQLSTQHSSLSTPPSLSALGPQTSALSFATIDVNLACPVKKIDRKSRGGHWLSQPAGAIAILKAVREALPKDVPCTVKLRRAYDDTPEMARNFEIIFNAAYELGYAWATVHARTVEQKYIGPSRWPFLKDLCSRHPDKPVFGSGDIWDAPDIFRMIAYTGVVGVSVARGCIGNPWIFRQARQMLAGQTPTKPTLAEQRAVLLDHFEISRTINGEKAGGRMMRKFGIKFAQHHPDPDAVKQKMIGVNTLDDWMAVLDELYAPSPVS